MARVVGGKAAQDTPGVGWTRASRLLTRPSEVCESRSEPEILRAHVHGSSCLPVAVLLHSNNGSSSSSSSAERGARGAAARLVIVAGDSPQCRAAVAVDAPREVTASPTTRARGETGKERGGRMTRGERGKRCGEA
ncbi:hypothetical protein AAFF_G00306590 [Aldrovandia affinis]|uniref:Uncharacterized protein n=1 Tax=Aldrovandia affinis TaxID=143900 RepID=A0AAD7R8A2_9TELE|nr:hypothetical protein AAFF_G00306590 [Aldrovandia affinis]